MAEDDLLPLLRYRDVAQLAGVSLASVENQARAGRLRKTLIGHAVRFHPNDVAEWINSGRQPLDTPETNEETGGSL